jgi:hypothetical protein
LSETGFVITMCNRWHIYCWQNKLQPKAAGANSNVCVRSSQGQPAVNALALHMQQCGSHIWSWWPFKTDQYNLTAAAHAPDAIKPFCFIKVAVETNDTGDTSNFNCCKNNSDISLKRPNKILQ